jgi:hypothetical protein
MDLSHGSEDAPFCSALTGERERERDKEEN